MLRHDGALSTRVGAQSVVRTQTRWYIVYKGWHPLRHDGTLSRRVGTHSDTMSRFLQ